MPGPAPLAHYGPHSTAGAEGLGTIDVQAATAVGDVSAGEGGRAPHAAATVAQERDDHRAPSSAWVALRKALASAIETSMAWMRAAISVSTVTNSRCTAAMAWALRLCLRKRT